MMALFLCAVLAEYVQPGIIWQAHSSLLAQTERTYKSAPTNMLGQLMITIFRIGSIAMALCLCLCTPEHGSFATYADVCGLIVAFLVAKMLCNLFIDYVFMISRRFMPSYEQYGDLVTMACCALFVCLPFVIRFGNAVVGVRVLAAVAILFLILWTYRLMRNYVRSLMAIVYIALYICTLEVLPLGLLFYLSSKTITLI
jgi:hypothetical protein